MERSNATKQFVQESGNLHLLKRLFLKHLTVKHMYAYIYKFSRRPRKHVKCTLHILHSGMVPPQLKRLRFLKLFQLEPRQKRRHVVRAMLRPWMPLLGQTTVFFNMTKHRNSSVMVQHGSTILHFSCGITCLTFPSFSRCLNPPTMKQQ